VKGGARVRRPAAGRADRFIPLEELFGFTTGVPLDNPLKIPLGSQAYRNAGTRLSISVRARARRAR
jgi:hypothetical protein